MSIRETAYEWHSGQWSALYAFACSGLVEDRDALAEEVRGCIDWCKTRRNTRKDQVKLERLERFILTKLQPCNSEPWEYQVTWKQ